jgi:hypothetical protein
MEQCQSASRLPVGYHLRQGDHTMGSEAFGLLSESCPDWCSIRFFGHTNAQILASAGSEFESFPKKDRRLICEIDRARAFFGI